MLHLNSPQLRFDVKDLAKSCRFASAITCLSDWSGNVWRSAALLLEWQAGGEALKATIKMIYIYIYIYDVNRVCWPRTCSSLERWIHGIDYDVNRVCWPRTCSSLERWIHGIDVKWSKQPVLPWPVGHLVSRRPTSTAAFPRLETSSRTHSTINNCEISETYKM